MRSEHDESGHWFDTLLPRVRLAKMVGLTDAEVVVKLVTDGQASAPQVWLCIHSARILDG